MWKSQQEVKMKKVATQLFYDIAWQVYKKMGKFSWWIAKGGNRSGYDRVLKATQLFRFFPFNSPSYHWEEVQTDYSMVGFNCTKCPVADYFKAHKLSSFCSNTWCALDFPLAQLWNSELERTGSIAEGFDKCDFRWKVNDADLKKNNDNEKHPHHNRFFSMRQCCSGIWDTAWSNVWGEN